MPQYLGVDLLGGGPVPGAITGTSWPVSGGAAMAKTTEPAPARRRRNWRHRENRASPKYVSKRVTEQDHAALVRYAEDHGVKIAELLAPFVAELVARAHDYCEQLDTAAALPARFS